MSVDHPPIAEANTEPANGCPVTGGRLTRPVEGGNSNRDWWPNQLNLKVLHSGATAASPLGPDFDYAAALESLDVDGLRRDIETLMTESQDWWPADFGNYGPLFVRMSWHAAGTYRVHDGRGGAGTGMQRFAPLNSWPDNVLLDRARRLLWPVKQKYGNKVSWADLLVFAGNVALDAMGLRTAGFAFGRVDGWVPDEDVYWGPEHTWLGDERYTGKRDLESPLAAVQMGLIYVNPEGPNGNPDPIKAGVDIRETFGRMAMNDEETAALIVGGHAFGKTHGNGDGDRVGPEPESAPLEQQGIGWRNPIGTGKGPDAMGSGLEGVWTSSPTRWDNSFLEILYGYEWELFTSPAGAQQWRPKDGAGADAVPTAFGGGRTHPTMLTTDLSMRFDPIYGEITRRWLDHPEELTRAFADAWFKLIHRDMGPVSRYRGPLLPQQSYLWQDPIPVADGAPIGADDIAALKDRIRESGLTVAQLVSTAWAAASSFRGSDLRGGANGGRIRLQPQAGWEANEPDELAQVVRTLEAVQTAFNAGATTPVSFADLVVLGGVVGVEQAARAAGHEITVPFSPGRTDATQEQTDVESFAYLEPRADGFRNYLGKGNHLPAEYLLIDKASLLNLSVPETTVLVGGLRVLGANHEKSAAGVFTDKPGTLTNDFFVNLLDQSTTWTPTGDESELFEGRDASGAVRWTASRADLVFGANAQLRASAEVYGSADARDKFVTDFVAAWAKVMDLDRFDLA